ncbi:ATP-binding cassette domain-containing protein [Nonomuraea sp. SYSU D8015]|uniref:ATP-binding cassette domain-containing protein n=1 Tax=Nonomuraea sp. SYSU D8015 TaxID=2593644 RepID=UPI0021CE6236|nr:ATP-binding cassette domain-containing protein [Nonomuraea sp. SYSU D8015]
MSLIEAYGLTKVFRLADKPPGFAGSLRHLIRPRYQEHVAVREVDLRIEAGEAVAYGGPNGAGKSTTVKLLSGIVVPTAGEVRVADACHTGSGAPTRAG